MWSIFGKVDYVCGILFLFREGGGGRGREERREWWVDLRRACCSSLDNARSSFVYSTYMAGWCSLVREAGNKELVGLVYSIEVAECCVVFTVL